MNFYRKNLLKEKSVALFAVLLVIFAFIFVSCSDQKARDDIADFSAKLDGHIADQAREKEVEAKAKAEEAASFKASLDEIKSGLDTVKKNISSINTINAQQTAKINKVNSTLTNLIDKMDKKYAEMQSSLEGIEGQISDSTKLSSDDIGKINESIASLKESALSLQTNKAEKADIEGLDARIKAIESIDVGALSARVNSLEEFKIYISNEENVNSFVKDLQCVKEYIELITNMQEQINKLQTDIENQKNAEKVPIQPIAEKIEPVLPVATPDSTQPSIKDKVDTPEVVPTAPVVDTSQPPAAK